MKKNNKQNNNVLHIKIPDIEEMIVFEFTGKGEFATYPSVLFQAFLDFLKDRDIYTPNSDLASS